MTIPQIKHQLSKQYPLIKFKEEKEGDITFLFHNLEDEDLHSLDFNSLANRLEEKCDVPVSIEFNKRAI
jgi:acyl carrier protein